MDFNEFEFDNNQTIRLFPIRIMNLYVDDLPMLEAEHHELILLDIHCDYVDQFLSTNKNKMALFYTWLLVDLEDTEVRFAFSKLSKFSEK